MTVIQKLTWTEYEAIDAMNCSTLTHGLRSMRSLRRAIDSTDMERSDAMDFGQVYHAKILEPEDFDNRFAVMPNFARDPQNVTDTGKKSTSAATKYVKQRQAQWRDENPGVVEVSEFDHWRVTQIENAIKRHPFASELVETSDTELSLVGEIGGVPFKGRVDLLKPGVMADLKGCTDAEPRAFGRDAVRFNYWLKVAAYVDLAEQNGNRIEDVYLIAVETSGEFDCVVYRVPEPCLDAGRKQLHKTLQRYRFAMEKNRWPGIDDGQPWLMLDVPNWAMPDDGLDWG